jgi:phage portal protein BeeE
MKLLGWTITRNKALTPVDNHGGWFSLIRESFAGAWQRDITIRVENVLTYTAVFSCISLIANDIGKLRLRLVRQDDDGIWLETESSAFSPVLRRPNRYQNRIQFVSQWVTSKLVHGNTYVLKQRDQRGIVTALYILHPLRGRCSWPRTAASITSLATITCLACRTNG